MKTKLLSRGITLFMVIAITLATPTVTFAVTNDDYSSEIQYLVEALNDIGLDIDGGFLQQQRALLMPDVEYIPHLSRLSQDAPIQIQTKSDLDHLLAFAQIIVDNNISAFSWDTCVDEAISEANLENYWRSEFRKITQAAREQELYELMTTYTIEELKESGLFDRYGIFNELQSLGFYLPQQLELSLIEDEIIPSSTHFRTIPLQTLHRTQWRSHFVLLAGNSVTYSISYRLDVGPPATQFATGVARSGSTGVGDFQTYFAGVNTATSSRTINIASNASGSRNFAINPGGTNSFIISGSYTVRQ